MDIIISVPKNLAVVFLPRLSFYCQYYLFPANVIAKTFHYLQAVIFLKLTSLNFPLCHLLQVNHCQNFICCLIMKVNVQKHKKA